MKIAGAGVGGGEVSGLNLHFVGYANISYLSVKYKIRRINIAFSSNIHGSGL